VQVPYVSVDAAALRNNLAVARRFAPGARVIAAVKANAYGHGLAHAARALAGADAFGVARVEEGLGLRAAGISQPIVVLEGVFGANQLEAAATHDLQLVVHSSRSRCWSSTQARIASRSGSRSTPA
jgi:alanine racemase